MKPETRAAHGHRDPDPVTGAVIPSIQPSTTYARDESYRLIGPSGYARDDNPTLDPAEELLASLEGGAQGLLFSSGMAAATTLVQAGVRPGDHIVGQTVMYWALRLWLKEFCARWGVALDLCPPGDLDALKRLVRPGLTKIIWVETPANPTLELVDIEAVAAVAHEADAILAVDSTVATPVHTRPLEFGADVVMHSATKLLNGHGDVVAGALVSREHDALWSRIRGLRKAQGAILGSLDAWLLLRGMRTLYLRARRTAATALELASRLADHRGVSGVRYPGLPSHAGFEIARRQMTEGFGGLLSIHTRSRERALAVAGRLRVFVRATSLGGTESLVEHRASIEGDASPVPSDLLRLSIGLEHVDDLWADLDQALRD